MYWLCLIWASEIWHSVCLRLFSLLLIVVVVLLLLLLLWLTLELDLLLEVLGHGTHDWVHLLLWHAELLAILGWLHHRLLHHGLLHLRLLHLWLDHDWLENIDIVHVGHLVKHNVDLTLNYTFTLDEVLHSVEVHASARTLVQELLLLIGEVLWDWEHHGVASIWPHG